MLAKWLGVAPWDLEQVPYWHIEQARTVRAAEIKAQHAVQERQARKSRR